MYGVSCCLMLASVSGNAGTILSAHVDVVTSPLRWTYTVVNDEMSGSPNFVTTFLLAVDAPISVSGTPTGWDFNTDGLSYVFWFNTDLALPYPNDIAPGGFLSGFAITSSVSTSAAERVDLSAWDHVLDEPGPTLTSAVLAPSSSVPSTGVPEPVTFWVVAGGVLLIVRSARSRIPLPSEVPHDLEKVSRAA